MKNNKKILFLLLALALICYFRCNSKGSATTDSSKEYPLFIGKDINEPKQLFSNINRSYFSAESDTGPSSGPSPGPSSGPSPGPSSGPSPSPSQEVVDIKKEISNKNETKTIILSKYPNGTSISNLIDDKNVPECYYNGGEKYNNFYQIGYMIMNYNENTFFNFIKDTYTTLPDYPSDIDNIRNWISGLNPNTYNALSYIVISLLILNNKYIFNTINHYIKNDYTSNFLKKIQLSKYLINIDIINGKTSIGNGWIEYIIPDINVSKDTNLTPKRIDLSKPFKNIFFIYNGNSSDENSKIKFNIKGIKNLAPSRISTSTAWFDDNSSFNLQIYNLPLVYPDRLTSFNFELTCSTGKASIKNAKLLFVYY